MNFISKIFSSAGGGIIDSIGNVVDKFIETPDEKAALKIEIEKIVTERMKSADESANKEMAAKSAIVVAEMNQGDSYTKRARPTVVYMGLVFIGINYVVFPLIGRIANGFGAEFDTSPLADLPSDFWYAWGGICATWSIGRTMEKRGGGNKRNHRK